MFSTLKVHIKSESMVVMLHAHTVRQIKTNPTLHPQVSVPSQVGHPAEGHVST